MTPVPLMQVDAFTSAPFGGNPAAVCWLDAPRPAAWMQAVAREMNLSETAFVEPRAEGGFGLRWFTPAVEVDLCGHATLASAHALWQWGRLALEEPARFLTRSGWLTATRESAADAWIVASQVGDAPSKAGIRCRQSKPRLQATSGSDPSQEWSIHLDFPARAVEPAAIPPGLEAALGGVQATYCGNGPGALGVNYVLEVATEAEVRAASPDFAALRRLPLRSVTVTSRGEVYDCVSRFFAPAGGVDEDSVTGSAHTQLATYWARKLGRTQLRAYQASARGGELGLDLRGDRVRISGHAVTVFRAELLA